MAELVALQAADVDSKRQLIRVRQGKGRQDREVLLPARLLESLRAYWKAFQPIVWLFPGQDPQRPISTRSVRLVCRQAAKKAKLAKRVEPLRPRLTHPTTFKPLSVGPAASFIGLYRKRPAIQGQHALPGNTARRALPIQHSPIPAVIGLSPYHYSGNA